MTEYDDSLDAMRSAVERLSSAELVLWFRNRMFNREAMLPARQSEPPYLLVAKIYPIVDRQVQRDFERAFGQMVREIASGSWSAEAAVNLLMLADPILLGPRNYHATEALRSVATNRRTSDDVCLAALQALVTIDDAAPPVFWLDILEARNDRFIPTVIEALARTALPSLETWLLSKLPDPGIESAFLSVMPYLIRRRGEEGVWIVAAVEPHMSERSQERIGSFIKRQKISFAMPGEDDLAVRQADVFRVLHTADDAAGRAMEFAVTLEFYRRSLLRYTERTSTPPQKLLSLWRGYDTAISVALEDQKLAETAAADLIETLKRWDAYDLADAVYRHVTNAPGLRLHNDLRDRILRQVVQYQPNTKLALTPAERRDAEDYVQRSQRAPARDDDFVHELELLEFELIAVGE